MATIATATLNNGTVTIPEEMLRSQHFEEGARIEMIETSSGVLLRVEKKEPRYNSWDGLTFEEILTANKKRLGLSDESPNWMALQGIFANSSYDPNLELELEKMRELESESR